ncbi:uncharacterized protein LOC132536282 [Erinaceus europaeus]|uniref:Uncharacterized protein LOC132536282 n=1 Tax=Erinaceus europaeus TaxID=9365 RepID=A0ABM3WTJ0_ERIEU|nr:uncharacterized protein LOC132536282 [Erinaceus europaeus]
MTRGAGWGARRRRGACRGVGAAEPQPGWRARPPRQGAPPGVGGGRPGPRICAAGGASPARRPCGPLRPCGLCAGRAAESGASEREKYKYGRPRQWEKRPGHFLAARAAENGLVECAGASPRRVLCVSVCVCARRKGLSDSRRAHAHSHARIHTRTRGGARWPRVCLGFLATSPSPTDCVRISSRSAPISAILGKLHKNKPSGLFLPGGRKVLREARRRGPAAAVRARKGAGPGLGPGARAVAAFAPRCAAPTRVRARACVGRRRPQRRRRRRRRRRR